MLEDGSGIEQDFGLSTDFAGAMFLPACIEEMVESQNYADARFSENDFCRAESIVSKKATSVYVDHNSQVKSATERTLNKGFVTALKNKLCMDALTETAGSNTDTKYPLSSTSSTSESPTGTLTPLEQQNELWQAIGSLDIFLVDNDIIEACEKSHEDQSGKTDDDLLGTPSVSLVEFLQQYKELSDWLKQVQEITHRDVTCLSEKYLHLSYHEEMLERSPHKQLLTDYSNQLLLRCPKVASEVNERMATLNTQWVDLEREINASCHLRNPVAMQKDLQKDMTTLRQWLTAVEAVLLPLTIQSDWTHAELEGQLKEHQILQQDIESHNRIINAVLQLSQQLDNAHGLEKDRVSNSFHLVALNLQRRWHGIWLQSLEWQYRLEESISRREGYQKSGLNFCTCSLPVVTESSLSNSSSSTDIHDLLDIDDEDFLLISHPDNSTKSARLHTVCQHEDFRQIIIDRHKSPSSVFHDTLCSDYVNFEVQTTNDHDNLSVSLKSGDSLSATGIQRESENPSKLFPVLAEDRSFAKEHLNTVRNRKQSFSASALRGHASDSVESLSNIRYPFINYSGVSHECPVIEDHDHSFLTSAKLLFDLSSGDSANISESESKMGDFPPAGEQEDVGGLLATSSEGEGEPHILEVKDIGYSSDSLSNDEEDVLHHQIGIECKFPGKCEVASDGPLGEKVVLPSVATRPEYYFMTLVDIDSTDKTDNGDTTDSGAEKMKKCTAQYRFKSAKDVPKLEVQCLSLPRSGTNQTVDVTGEDKSKQADKYSHSLNDSWSFLDLAASSISDRYCEETKSCSGNTFKFPAKNECSSSVYEFSLENERVSPTFEFSDSDNIVESEERNSIKYLIDHAEDLVKYPSPRKQHPKSPSKQTQTDPLSMVESSCDASAEDNSEFESQIQNGLVKEDLSTATDDADETLFNSVINIDSVEDSVRSEHLDHTIMLSPDSPVIIDSPHLRKQSVRRRHQKGDARPWSVAGLDNIILSKKSPNNAYRISAVSESAINHLHFHTNNDLPSWLLMSSQSMSPSSDSHSRRIHRSSTSCDQISSQLYHSSFDTQQSMCGETTFSTTYLENVLNSDGSLATQIQPMLDVPLPYAGIPSQTSLNKTSNRHSISKTSPEKYEIRHSTEFKTSPEKHETRHSSECKTSPQKHEIRHPNGSCSWASDVFDSAQSEPGSEASDKYQTARLELATSDGDDVHNVSGSLSESSAWDNYQMLYPTASEDPGEELMTWEPQDDLEFDDDFLLRHQKEPLVKNGMINVHKHTELSLSQQNLLVEDSDSELEDFHHILDQTELALKKAEQSLVKLRNHPASPGHGNSIKYPEIIKMYETSMGCLKSICQHLKTENVPENDVKRVQALMCQWEELHNLATEYQTYTKFLGDVAGFIIEAQTHIQETENCITCDGLTTAEELMKVITLLKERKTTLKQQEQQLHIAYNQLMEFSALHPMKHAERFSKELPCIQKAIAAAVCRVSDHVERQTEWLEYFERQHRLNVLLTTDREKMHKMLCQQQYGMQVKKKDVLKNLEILRNNVSLHESELTLLQSMWLRLTENLDPSAQGLLASIGDLRNQLLVMSQRCCQIHHYIEEDDGDTLEDQQSDLGKLAMYSTALHEASIRPKKKLTRSSSMETLPVTSSANRKLTRSYTYWLCSLPAQVVALMLVTGLICALDPDILDHLTNMTLKISPELRFVNGPPAT